MENESPVNKNMGNCGNKTIKLFEVNIYTEGPGQVSSGKRVIVEEGGDVVILITPNKGCFVRYLFLDGSLVLDYDRKKGSFTIKKVTEKHYLRVEFAEGDN